MSTNTYEINNANWERIKDMQDLSFDSTSIKVRQHVAGAQRGFKKSN